MLHPPAPRFTLSLQTCAHGWHVCNLVNPATVQALAGLPALTRLFLMSGIKHGSLVPSCEELACLRSTSLRDLTVSIDQVPDDDQVYIGVSRPGLLVVGWQ